VVPVRFGFHASHEQLPPSRLLQLAVRAEAAGFDELHSSDHFAPWTAHGGHAGFSYAWLGAAVAATSLPVGLVTAPGYRYHPAIVAQAIATLADLAPGRVSVALGSGQALNEHVTGEPWPGKAERNRRLAACAQVIRSLLAGEEVDVAEPVAVRRAQLATLPPEPVPLFAAALSPETAASVGAWADGLVTVDCPAERLRAVIEAFRDAAGRELPVRVQLHLSWAGTDEEARRLAAEHWRTNALPAEVTEELPLPSDFDAACREIGPDDLTDSVLMSADPERHADRLRLLADLGVEVVHLHHVGPDQERFLAEYPDQVLARVR
jgi:probable non-F420 flavinoid oxidoreductase